MKNFNYKAFIDLLVKNMDEDDILAMILYLKDLKSDKIAKKEKPYPEDWDDFVEHYLENGDVFYSTNAVGYSYEYLVANDTEERIEQFRDYCYPTLELSNGSVTLSKLLCLRTIFVKDWNEPADKERIAKFYPKYDCDKNRWYSEGSYSRLNVLSFQNKELCDTFIDHYCDLLDDARIYL